MRRANILAMIVVGITLPFQGNAQAPPVVGKEAASKYFEKDKPAPQPAARSYGSDSRYLAVHLGPFLQSESYVWGPEKKETEVGEMTAGVSYRIGEWVQSMDLLFRADYNSYKVGDQRASKMSFLPVITFPDARSRFPLYFGGGLGLGVFFKQLEGESSVSLDYQLIMGVRLFDLFGSAGLFMETGMKNHINLLTDGQYNGTFLSMGGVFAF